MSANLSFAFCLYPEEVNANIEIKVLKFGKAIKEFNVFLFCIFFIPVYQKVNACFFI